MSVPRKRPGIVTACAVILMVLGGFSVLTGLCGVAGSIVIAMLPEPAGPPAPEDILGNILAGPRKLAKEVPGYSALQIIGLVASLLFGSAEFIAGLGCWNVRPWGRYLANVTVVVYLLYAIASQIFAVIYVLPVAEEIQKEQMAKMPPGAPDMSGFTKAVEGLSLGCAIAFYLTIALVILIGLNVKSARDAFAGIAPAPEDPRALDEDRPPKKHYEGYEDES